VRIPFRKQASSDPECPSGAVRVDARTKRLTKRLRAGEIAVIDHTDLDRVAAEALAEARRTIDNIDAALIHILAERFRCTQRVGHIKAVHDLPPADPEREARQVARLRALAVRSGLDPDFAEKFLSFMVREVIRHHEDIKAEYEGAG